MGKCGKCDIEIDDKYKFCFACSQEMKTQAEPQQDGLIVQMQKNNNNLYKLTRQLDVLIREKYNIAVVWDKEQHDFIEKKL